VRKREQRRGRDDRRAPPAYLGRGCRRCFDQTCGRIARRARSSVGYSQADESPHRRVRFASFDLRVDPRHGHWLPPGRIPTRRGGGSHPLGERAVRADPRAGHTFGFGRDHWVSARTNHPRRRHTDAGSAKNRSSPAAGEALHWRTLPRRPQRPARTVRQDGNLCAAAVCRERYCSGDDVIVVQTRQRGAEFVELRGFALARRRRRETRLRASHQDEAISKGGAVSSKQGLLRILRLRYAPLRTLAHSPDALSGMTEECFESKL